jgi:2'-5' RNA ligase
MPPLPLRLFIAVELTAEVKQGLARLQDDLKRQLPPKVVRWTQAEGIHLTLKFLGDTPQDKVQAIVQGITAAGAGFSPFSFDVAGFGCFPNPRKANVLWVGVSEMPKTLAGLQRAVDLRMHTLGYEKESRPFSPHLTLGRVNKTISPGERQKLADVIAKAQVSQLGTVPVREVILFQSDLRPTGSVYTALARIGLAGSDENEERP